MKKWLLILALFVSSCRPYPGPPWQHWMYEGPPPAKDGQPYPELYVLGWQHGCESGTGAITNNFYKTFHAWRQDATLAQNKVYYQGWKDAFGYCTRYLQQYFAKPFL